MENKVIINDKSGIVTEFKTEGDKFTIVHKQKTLPIYQENYNLRKNKGRWNESKDDKHIARIPLVKYMLWESLGITPEGDPAAFTKALKRHKDEVMVTDKNI